MPTPPRSHLTSLRRSGRSGFTRLELLVVVAIVAVLAGLRLSALSKSKADARAILCLNNLRQLMRGWHLYAGDYNDNLVRSAGLESAVTTISPTKNYPLNQWCMGDMSTVNGMTNSQLIMDSLLYKYINSLAAYKCPADRKNTADPWGRKAGQPAARSSSMNCWMNPINPWAADGKHFTNFRRLGGILRPTETWVILDESPTSINDGWFACDPVSTQWIDIPATYHNQAGGLSFADGRAEIKRWRDPALMTLTFSGSPKDGRVDLKWLQARSTYGPNGPPQ